MTLFDEIGLEKLTQIVTRFYGRAVDDPLIGHFFFNHDVEHLIAMQVAFTAKMLGRSGHSYGGKPLREAHAPLGIRGPHFARRQVLLGQVMDECGLAAALRDQWLAKEQALEALILSRV